MGLLQAGPGIELLPLPFAGSSNHAEQLRVKVVPGSLTGSGHTRPGHVLRGGSILPSGSRTLTRVSCELTRLHRN